MPDNYPQLAALFGKALARHGNRNAKTILDFGCGAGGLLKALNAQGFDAYGCDVADYLDASAPRDRFAKLTFNPYRLPYPDNFFDAVISTSVLEHAQNTEEALREIRRVLKPGGLSMHLVPGKWYLPTEPHIFVPLVSWLWPNVPSWWLRFWAWAGVRNPFQQGKSAAEVADINRRYVRDNLVYLSTRQWKRLSMQVFGNVAYPMDLFLSSVDGGVSRLWKALPFKRTIEWLSRETRMGFMVQRKA